MSGAWSCRSHRRSDTRKALRFFAERRIKTHFVDLQERAASPGELRRFAQKFGVEALVDRGSRRYAELGLGAARLSEDRWLEKLPLGLSRRTYTLRKCSRVQAGLGGPRARGISVELIVAVAGWAARGGSVGAEFSRAQDRMPCDGRDPCKGAGCGLTTHPTAVLATSFRGLEPVVESGQPVVPVREAARSLILAPGGARAYGARSRRPRLPRCRRTSRCGGASPVAGRTVGAPGEWWRRLVHRGSLSCRPDFGVTRSTTGWRTTCRSVSGMPGRMPGQV